MARQELQDNRWRLRGCRQFKIVFIKLHPHACPAGQVEHERGTLMRFVQAGRAVFAEEVREGRFASAPYETAVLPFFKSLARAVQLLPGRRSSAKPSAASEIARRGVTTF